MSSLRTPLSPFKSQTRFLKTIFKTRSRKLCGDHVTNHAYISFHFLPVFIDLISSLMEDWQIISSFYLFTSRYLNLHCKKEKHAFYKRLKMLLKSQKKIVTRFHILKFKFLLGSRDCQQISLKIVKWLSVLKMTQLLLFTRRKLFVDFIENCRQMLSFILSYVYIS